MNFVRNHVVVSFVLVSAGVLAFACTSSTTGGGSSPGSGGASGEQISRCKQGCDKMKFFKCSSAEEQARCYGDCDKATPSQIEVFTGCAENSICDPSCRTSIQPAPSGGTSGGTTGGGGASASSCTTACDKLVTCSLIPVGAKTECMSECQSKAYQYQIDCINGNECNSIAKTCGSISEGGGETSSSGGSTTSSGGSGSFEISRCQNACDQLQFFDCLDATQHGDCRNLCTTAAAAKRDTFTSCANGAGSECTKGLDCYTTFKQ